MDLILNRRSIRKYEERTVEKDKIEKLLRSAMQAPSAANQQPWEFIVVEDKDILKKLADTSPYSGIVANSAVTFVLLSRKEGLMFPDFSLQDIDITPQKKETKEIQIH
ncbi:MAG: nitroreductase family protein [Clostridium sp.]|uniref:nitroreductase family protein n=1 Tax=Clostridium sp. TaxID=1506 RepID=UPI0039E827D8